MELWKLCCIEGKPQNWVVHTDLEISFNLWLLESTFSIRNSKVKLRLRMIKAVGGFWGCPDGIRPSKCRFDQTFSYLLQRRCCFLSFFIIMQVSRLCPKLASSTGVYSAKRTAASPDRGVQPQIIWQRCQHLDHYQSVLCIIILVSRELRMREKNETWLWRNWLLLASDHDLIWRCYFDWILCFLLSNDQRPSFLAIAWK